MKPFLLSVFCLFGCGKDNIKRLGRSPKEIIYFMGNDHNSKATHLVVDVTNLRTADGLICLSIYNELQSYPTGTEKVFSQCYEIVDRPAHIQIDGLPPGDYAVSSWHDENRDGHMNQNVTSIPTEGFGFSNGQRYGIQGTSVKIPTFAESKFTLKEKETTHTEMIIDYVF